MDIANESLDNGGDVTVFRRTGGANQRFELARLRTGFYAMLAYHSGLSLDVWDFSKEPGGEVRQHGYLGNSNQQWRIEPVEGGFYVIRSRLSGLVLTAVDGKVRQETHTGAANQQWRFEAVAGPNYQLVWSEEFNEVGMPNPAKWSYEEGRVRNNEAQHYTVARPENVGVRNGLLTITARRESYQGAAYTSASLHTRDKASWTYGRFEMRARIDTRNGLWPAFWMLGPGKWPEGGEIDIMEFYRGKILSNVAWKANNADAWSAAWDSSTRSLDVLRAEDPDWSQQFHVWRMDWTRDQIRLYVDDVLMNSTDLRGVRNPDGSNPFRDKRMYLLVNLAIGGNNGGDPAGTGFPSLYEIDYLRVYQ